jgi:hypothetical protein
MMCLQLRRAFDSLKITPKEMKQRSAHGRRAVRAVKKKGMRGKKVTPRVPYRILTTYKQGLKAEAGCKNRKGS